MKKLLFAAAVSAMMTAPASAQYFRYVYGTTGADVCNDGHNTNLNGVPGSLLVGPGSVNTTFAVTRTNFMGQSTSAGLFNKQYRLADMAGGAPALKVQDLHSVETQGTHYALAGSYINGAGNPSFGVFFQRLNAAGTLLGTPKGYTTALGSGYTNVHVQKVIASTRFAGDFYILGYATNSSNLNRVFVIRVDAAGTAAWSKIYMIGTGASPTEIPYDIVETDAPHPGSRVVEVLVVGEQRQGLAGKANGFLLRLDGLNGNTQNPIYFYGNAASEDILTSIKLSDNTAVDPGGNGYVLGGYSDVNGSNDFWFLALNQVAGVSWSKTYDYVKGSALGGDNRCSDIAEHLDNTTGQYEYFLAGYVAKGFSGDEDVVVMRTNQTGTATPNSQYTYYAPGNQRCVRMTCETGTYPGLYLFGNAVHVPAIPAPLGSTDRYLIKAKFDGSSACSTDIQTPAEASYAPVTSSLNNDLMTGLNMKDLFSSEYSNMDEYKICSDCDGSALPPLVAHWNFTGGSLVDPINGLTGTIFGGVTPATGKAGVPNTAYSFDGSSGYIRVPSNPVLDLSSWTITALVKPMGFYSGLCQDNAIVWRAPEYSANHYDLRIFDNAFDHDCNVFSPTKEVAAGAAAGTITGTSWMGTTPCVSNPCIVPGNWYCLWLSYNATAGVLDLYVNGTLTITQAWPNLYGPPTIQDLFIGRGNDIVNWPYFFNGVIDDIAIYGGPLSCPALSCTNQENGLARKTTEINVPEALSETVTIAPNPSTGSVTVRVPLDWTQTQIHLYNAVGQLVHTWTIEEQSKTVDIAELPSGIYVMSLTNQNKQKVVKRIAKQ
ncbi:MAG: T9SS type A sorting domain-containing protein [Chitinophagaceae bacterium]|nr:T9SS type A sorting domain-containing protein [Chitinophagaceae bacterium]